MRMSTRIFLTMFFLAAVALAVMGLGIWSLYRVSDAINDINNVIDRALAINAINDIQWRRAVAEKNIILLDDEKKMRDIADGELAATEKEMEAGIVKWRNLIPADAGANVKALPDLIRDNWSKYVKISGQIATLALKNSNTRALAILNADEKHWNEADAIVKDLLARIKQRLNKVDDNAANASIAKIDVDRMRSLGALEASITGYYKNAARLITEPDEQKMTALEKELAGVQAGITSSLAELLTLYKGTEHEARITAINTLVTPLMGHSAEITALSRDNSNIAAQNLSLGDGATFRTELNRQMDNAIDRNTTIIAQVKQSALNTVANSVATMLAVSAVGIAIAMFWSFRTVSGISRRLSGLVDSMTGVSQQVSSASGSLSAAAQNLSEGATEQAASLEETSSALEQMASMTRQNADNATQTNGTTVANNNLIGEGATAVRNMSKAMAEISDSAEKISQIIKTIEEIAFQTNLLALNAAVEAARAGEAGKGFAVVADEVRSLAQRSAQAAKDTTELIQGTVERVRNGTGIAENLSKSFTVIEDGSRKIGELIAQITSATNEQAQGVDQVNTAVAQMDKVTQQNAAGAEESAAAAEELLAQADTLNEMVENLMRLVDGDGGGDRSARPATPPPASKGGRASGFSAAFSSSAPHSAAVRALPPPHANKVKVMHPSDVIPLEQDGEW